MKNNRRGLLLILTGALLLILLTVLSIPHIADIETVPMETMEEYPELQNAYVDLCEKYGLHEIATEEYIQIVTVKNLWGSWNRYILPCFAADAPTVPTAGNTTFTAFMHVLAPWSEENIFTRLCPVALTLNVCMTPGENTFVLDLFEAIPEGAVKDPQDIIIFEKVNCDKDSDIFIYYTVVTYDSAKERDQTAEATFQWKYFLKLCGKQILFGSFSLDRDYIINT